MTFKPLNENDIVNTRTLLHEAIPLTGSMIHGTYGGLNQKNYSHGMFTTVYDYNYLSSSANHIFDITCGVSGQSLVVDPAATAMATKKRNIYGQMAQILMGYDATGSVQRFDEDGDLFGNGGVKMDEVIVIPFSRLVAKDEIKKETFEMRLALNSSTGVNFSVIGTISDAGASTEYRVNSPAGEYGILYTAGNAGGEPWASANPEKCGLIFYQAGIAVLTGSVFSSLLASDVADFDGSGVDVDNALTNSSIENINNAVLNRIDNIQFNNTTELNSTVYFCRANHNEFNYSSNPTYLENSRIRVKTQATDEPVSYITTIGLYNDRNELLATAKLSEALKKSPSTEFTIRARLDY